MMDEEREYTDFANVEIGRDYVTGEEFPDGAYGSAIRKDKPVRNKSTPWREGQRSYSAYNYENKTLHEGIPRQVAGAHPPHDEDSKHTEKPYNDV